jgi:hypothetical protein
MLAESDVATLPGPCEFPDMTQVVLIVTIQSSAGPSMSPMWCCRMHSIVPLDPLTANGTVTVSTQLELGQGRLGGSEGRRKLKVPR